MTTKESKVSPQIESYLNTKGKLAIALRLHRIEGQIRGDRTARPLGCRRVDGAQFGFRRT